MSDQEPYVWISADHLAVQDLSNVMVAVHPDTGLPLATQPEYPADANAEPAAAEQKHESRKAS